MTPISIIEANLKAMDKPGISVAARNGMSDRIKRNLNRLKDLQLIVQDIVDTPPFRPTPLRLDTFIRDTVDSSGRNAPIARLFFPPGSKHWKRPSSISESLK